MVVGGILLTILPISYVVLKLGAPAYSVFIIHFCVESVAQFFRMNMLRSLISLPIRAYLNNIYIPVVATVVMSIILPLIVHAQLAYGWLQFFAVCFTCVISVGLSIYWIGITKYERDFLRQKVLKVTKYKRV